MVPGKGKLLRMTNQEVVARLRTPGVLAVDLDVPLHRVLYILQTRDTSSRPPAPADCDFTTARHYR